MEAAFRRVPGLAGQFGIRHRRGRAIEPAAWDGVAREGAVVRSDLA